MRRAPRPVRRLWRVSGALGLLALLLVCPGPSGGAHAEDDDEEPRYVIDDQRVGRKLNRISDLLEEEDGAGARAVLDSFNLQRLDPYPLALVYQTYGFLAANDERHEEAIDWFQKAVAVDALPPERQLAIQFNVGQLYMLLDRYEEAIGVLEAWFEKAERPSAISWYMLAVAYYQNDQKDAALAPAERALELTDDPKERWLQLPLSLHLEKQSYREAIPLIEELIWRFPKKLYWTQLAAVLMALEEDEKSLAVQQLAYEQGYLDGERDVRRLAEMYLFHGLPWRAAKVLRREMERQTIEPDHDAWKLLSNALLAARENAEALPAVERAAELADTGDSYVQLAQLHIQREEWDRASEALVQAFDKGGLRNPAHASLLAGIVAFQQQRFDTARSALAKAAQADATREVAQQWLEFVEREVATLAARAAAAAGAVAPGPGQGES